MKSKIVVILFFLLFFGQAQAQNGHFWDGIETFDGPTDKNPILATQLDFYFDKLVAPLPDSITLEISMLIERTDDNNELRDFILWHLLQKYLYPEYMSQDQVFVWLYDQYFSQLEIKDLNETNLALIRDKAERLRRLALFNIAPDIKINDSIDLQTIESKYTVLFFYDHDCDLCQQELRDLDLVCAERPEVTSLKIDLNNDAEGLDEIYVAYDIEVTPLLYVLDCDKRIIAKKIRARQIGLVIK